MLFVVKYSGKFGFIKPWTAVRDGETYSQQFLTPSILKGMELKLFPESSLEDNLKITRYRLSYAGISMQQERVQSRGFQAAKPKQGIPAQRSYSILMRGVLIEPELYLAFTQEDLAIRASSQHLCLCRNEDIMLPDIEIQKMTESEFDAYINGFELIPATEENGFLVGYNRFASCKPMFGELKIFGHPIRKPVFQ
jgi:hypothetical protein